MKRVTAIIGSVIVITLAVMVGTKLSADAIAVIIGVIIGVAASVPTATLLIWFFSRQQVRVPDESPAQRGNYPPVVVVNPGQGIPPLPSPQPPVMQAPLGGRQYDVVGALEEEGEM